MKKFVFSVRDRACIMHLDPFLSPSKGGAERAFADAVNNPETPMYAHPEDYDLYEHGSFDTGTGMYEVGVPVQVACGKDVKRPAAAVSQMQIPGLDAVGPGGVNGSVRR